MTGISVFAEVDAGTAGPGVGATLGVGLGMLLLFLFVLPFAIYRRLPSEYFYALIAAIALMSTVVAFLAVRMYVRARRERDGVSYIR